MTPPKDYAIDLKIDEFIKGASLLMETSPTTYRNLGEQYERKFLIITTTKKH
jgi:hypothetical protein